jgi:L-ribulose-5-phosphate 3-epimerase
MLKGISYWSLPLGLEGKLPVDEALNIAKSERFQALELCIADKGELSVETSQAECERLRRVIDATGVVVETLASGMSWAFNPVSNDESVREKSFRLHEASLHRAAWLGCRALLYVPGVVCSPISPEERVRYDRAFGRAREIIGRLLDTAEQVGVDLCLENVWNGLFYSPLELIEFIDAFESNRLGVYFDVGNVFGYQQHAPHWIELLKQRIKRIHIKDFKEEFGWKGSYEFCALGAGDVPLEASIQVLREGGYDSTIVAEMLPWREGLLKETSTVMDKLLAVRNTSDLANLQ